MTISVVLVDDHPVFRIGMAALLDSLAGIRVTGQAASAAEAGPLLASGIATDVVLMDLDLGDGSGIDLTRDLQREHPGLRVLVVTMHEDDDAVVAAVRAGARGYLVKSAPPDAVERAVRAVAAGEMILSPAVAQRAMSYVLGGRTAARLPFPQLTDREREVLDLVAAGLDNETIARRLGLSPKTVRNHLANVLARLALPDRSAAIVRAREEGLGTSG
ncbi:response regulator [Cellulomonas humilata]|uniref:DNA-binding NarL/FixJ family response regulator n=1 Tax=Cellulomonas humilata TaxID=144055 RepID=A0ABU0EGB9_9CELL|nr:response regulator transcription factor [Cellulomonas humilata]MDQ0374267.1 DNA-binding NarL/FixJ family response regulator [Cellulomonas humilata]